MIRVLHFGAKTYPPSHGGVEKIVFDLAIGTSVESHVVADMVDGEFDDVIVRERGFLNGFFQLVKVCKERDINVVHFHKETSIPYALMLKAMGFKSILTLHGFGWKVPRWPLVARVGLWLADVLAYCLLDRVVFCSRNDYESVRRYMRIRRLVCIENGVDVKESLISFSSRSGGVFLGRVSPEKNVLSFGSISEKVSFSVYGPIDKRDKFFFETFTNAVNCGEITYHGPVESSDVPNVLSRYVFLVNVSFSEGLPVAVLEAAAQGLFLILSDIPAHRALGFPDCIYVDPKSPRFDSIDFSRLRVSEKNFLHVRNNYSLRLMKDNYDIVYKEVFNG